MDLYSKYNLRHVINACGKMTHLSSSIVPEQIIEQVAESLRHFFVWSEVHEAAGRVIAQATGAEWGCLTSCTSAGMTLSVAACMTGNDQARVEQLPDTSGMKNRVLIQKGHVVNYGAPVAQAIRLAGAEVVEMGSANQCKPFHIEHELAKGNVAAIMAVESHHTVRFGYVKLPQVVELAHKHGVPVIVDGAAQDLRMRELMKIGCDLVIFSAHKYLQSTTAGIVAGRKDLIEAVHLQNRGIGRAMKVGKEGVFGALAALEIRMRQDIKEWTAEQNRKVKLTLDLLQGVPGLALTIEADPNGCPFSRPKLIPDASVCGHTAASLTAALAEGDPAVFARAHRADEGYLCLDTIELTDDEIKFMCDRIRSILQKS